MKQYTITFDDLWMITPKMAAKAIKHFGFKKYEIIKIHDNKVYFEVTK